MDNLKSFPGQIYEVNDQNFADIALDVFRYQANANGVYRHYIQNLGIKPEAVSQIKEIPFLPVSFFKRHRLQSSSWEAEAIFTSSSTSGSVPSSHAVRHLGFYLNHSVHCFTNAFGAVSGYHFLALLPSYLERTGSSLIAMLNEFIQKSGSEYSGFYLHDHQKLIDSALQLRGSEKKVIIWGVTFALLDLAEKYDVDLSHCIFIETGGMKGRRREITRAEFYGVLRSRLKASAIYSEYGMTELLSQAYTTGDTRFRNQAFLRVIGRDLSDPFDLEIYNETTGLNIIDLANYDTISFIETEDLGKVYENGTFDVLGRIDNSDIRGCNLMI